MKTIIDLPVNIFFASTTWTPADLNPFSLDGEYGYKWSSFVYNENISQYTNSYPNAKVYSLSVNPDIDENFEKIVDFISYESYYNRNIILCVPERIREILKVTLFENKFSITSKEIRNSDNRWLVHSTTNELWKKIKLSGSLLSPNMLRSKGETIHEIGLKELLEPSDYSDFVMLDIMNGCGELVVNSRQLGFVCLDANIEYKPGVRLYFDAHKIIKDGLAIRDGLHILKIKNSLPLDKYLVLAIDQSFFENKKWTPSSFTDQSNNFFNSYVSKDKFYE